VKVGAAVEAEAGAEAGDKVEEVMAPF
jgi:hypothetical protein